jgi:hypothetical protein
LYVLLTVVFSGNSKLILAIPHDKILDLMSVTSVTARSP